MDAEPTASECDESTAHGRVVRWTKYCGLNAAVERCHSSTSTTADSNSECTQEKYSCSLQSRHRCVQCSHSSNARRFTALTTTPLTSDHTSDHTTLTAQVHARSYPLSTRRPYRSSCHTCRLAHAIFSLLSRNVWPCCSDCRHFLPVYSHHSLVHISNARIRRYYRQLARSCGCMCMDCRLYHLHRRWIRESNQLAQRHLVVERWRHQLVAGGHHAEHRCWYRWLVCTGLFDIPGSTLYLWWTYGSWCVRRKCGQFTGVVLSNIY